MTITLNGTTGITTPAQTVQGNLTTTGNTVLGDASTDTLNVANGGLVKDSSGNLGLGVTPSAWSLIKTLQLPSGVYLGSYTGSSTPNLYLGTNNYFNGTNFIYSGSYAATRYEQTAGVHAWYTAPSGTAGNAITFTQAMTLDSSGNLLVGSSSNHAVTSRQHIAWDSRTLSNGIGLTDTDPTSVGRYAQVFYRNGSNVGSIQTTLTATVYVTSSDYRLKENIAPMTGALAKVQALKPVTYTWKSTGEESQGFIAHELQAVVPDCVTGEKDAVDEEGNPVYQGIDTSFLVATLTAAIQELKAELDTVKAEVTALKGTA